jgi:hypothetical protein
MCDENVSQSMLRIKAAEKQRSTREKEQGHVSC